MLKQGTRTAEELVTEFKLLVSQAGMTDSSSSDNIHLIQIFRRTLNESLAKKILFSEKVPATIQGWCDRAIQYDTNWRMAMAILGKSTKRKNPGDNNDGKKTHKPKDPNAMDIDAMTLEERTALMKKGLCFICKKPGHRANDHKGKSKEEDEEEPDFS
jgi:hypothetical protein